MIFLDSYTCEVQTISGENEKFPVENILYRNETKTETYWLPKDQKNASLVLDLGCNKMINMVELANTHNGQARDMATKEFKVYVKKAEKDPWIEVVKGTLEDSRKQETPLPIKVFSFNGITVRFIKFEIVSFYGRGGGLQYLSWHYSDRCQVSVESGDQYNNDYRTEFLLNKEDKEVAGHNYWLGPDVKTGSFILDLGCDSKISMVQLINTHNANAHDRSTKEFKVLVSKHKDGPWNEVLHKVLVDSRKQMDPLPLQSFTFAEKIGKYVKFELMSFYGFGGGLFYFHVKGNKKK